VPVLAYLHLSRLYVLKSLLKIKKEYAIVIKKSAVLKRRKP
jgi:hypothetical protein